MNGLPNLVLLSAAIVGCTCNSQECPSPWFDVSFTFINDRLITFPFDTSDPELHHFRETLKLTEEEIEQVTQDAMEFFNKTYGLDFSKSPIDAAGRRHFENATMTPFEFPFDVTVSHNRFILTGDKGVNRCFPMQEGGYDVLFTGPQILRGTFGGVQGTLLPNAVSVTYTLHNFNFCRQQSTVVVCTSVEPSVQRSSGGYSSRVANCHNRQLGDGLLMGLNGVFPTDDPEAFRLAVRITLTFPAHV